MTNMKLWDKDKATGVNDGVVGKSRFCSQRSHCLIFTRPSSRLLGNSLNKKHKTTDIIVWIKPQDIISRRKDNFVKLWIKWVRTWQQNYVEEPILCLTAHPHFLLWQTNCRFLTKFNVWFDFPSYSCWAFSCLLPSIAAVPFSDTDPLSVCKSFPNRQEKKRKYFRNWSLKYHTAWGNVIKCEYEFVCFCWCCPEKNRCCFHMPT